MTEWNGPLSTQGRHTGSILAYDYRVPTMPLSASCSVLTMMHLSQGCLLPASVAGLQVHVGDGAPRCSAQTTVLHRHADTETQTLDTQTRRLADRDDARRKTQETRRTIHNAGQGHTQTQTLKQREKLLGSFDGWKSLSDVREEDISVIQRLARPGEEEGGWERRESTGEEQPATSNRRMDPRTSQKPSARVITFFFGEAPNGGVL